MKNIFNNKKIYMLLTLILLILLFLRIVYSDHSPEVTVPGPGGGPVGVNPEFIFKQQGFNPQVDAWYTVALWELEVCDMWGGTTLAQNTAAITGRVFISQTTATLQASYQDLPDGTRIYEVSHYMQPLQLVTRFAVKLTNDPVTGQPYRAIVVPADVAPGASNAAFNTFVAAETWSFAQMAIGITGNVNTIITVPVINSTGIFTGCTTGCGNIPATDPWTNWG